MRAENPAIFTENVARWLSRSICHNLPQSVLQIIWKYSRRGKGRAFSSWGGWRILLGISLPLNWWVGSCAAVDSAMREEITQLESRYCVHASTPISVPSLICVCRRTVRARWSTEQGFNEAGVMLMLRGLDWRIRSIPRNSCQLNGHTRKLC